MTRARWSRFGSGEQGLRFGQIGPEMYDSGIQVEPTSCTSTLESESGSRSVQRFEFGRSDWIVSTSSHVKDGHGRRPLTHWEFTGDLLGFMTQHPLNTESLSPTIHAEY